MGHKKILLDNSGRFTFYYENFGDTIKSLNNSPPKSIFAPFNSNSLSPETIISIPSTLYNLSFSFCFDETILYLKPAHPTGYFIKVMGIFFSFINKSISFALSVISIFINSPPFLLYLIRTKNIISDLITYNLGHSFDKNNLDICLYG